jgi:hypothetical protein
LTATQAQLRNKRSGENVVRRLVNESPHVKLATDRNSGIGRQDWVVSKSSKPRGINDFDPSATIDGLSVV